MTTALRPGVNLGATEVYSNPNNIGNVLPTLRAVIGFYSFWDSADPQWLDQAVASTFTDHHHEGRAPGKAGLVEAASAFHDQVPDFHVALDRVIVACPHVVVQGRGLSGETPLFRFTDVLKLDDHCLITDNWPLEGPNLVTHV